MTKEALEVRRVRTALLVGVVLVVGAILGLSLATWGGTDVLGAQKLAHLARGEMKSLPVNAGGMGYAAILKPHRV